MNIEKPTWNWQYCPVSGWSFQVGNPHLHSHIIKSKDLQRRLGRKKRTRPRGEFTLHVFYAQWSITRYGKKYVSSRCRQLKIETMFARLNGVDLKRITFHRDGWVKRAVFDEGYVLDVVPYVDAENDNIANWLKNDAE